MFRPIFYMIICSFVVDYFTTACIQRVEKGIRALTYRCLLLKTSCGVIIRTSGDNSSMSTPDRVHLRRRRPKPSSTLTASPLIAPNNIGILRPNNEFMMVGWAVQRFCSRVVMCRLSKLFFYLTSFNMCVLHRRLLTSLD